MCFSKGKKRILLYFQNDRAQKSPHFQCFKVWSCLHTPAAPSTTPLKQRFVWSCKGQMFGCAQNGPKVGHGTGWATLDLTDPAAPSHPSPTAPTPSTPRTTALTVRKRLSPAQAPKPGTPLPTSAPTPPASHPIRRHKPSAGARPGSAFSQP